MLRGKEIPNLNEIVVRVKISNIFGHSHDFFMAQVIKENKTVKMDKSRKARYQNLSINNNKHRRHSSIYQRNNFCRFDVVL